MRIGIAFDLKSDQTARAGGPDDLLEEYDSEETVEALAAALRERGHAPLLLGGGRGFVERVLANPPDLVFTIAEGSGSRSREAHVPAVCEMLRIPCTHSDPLTLAVTLDKAAAKKLVAADGVATPRFTVVEDEDSAARLEFELPAIVKPNQEGSSMGVRLTSRVRTLEELRRETLRVVRDYGEPALVEEYVSGTEMTIGILGTGKDARVIGAMEIAPRIAKPEEFVYSLEVKRDWERQVEYHVPPRVPPATLRAAEHCALAAYRALGCRDIARVDVRLDARGTPKFLEANPLPGMNPRTGDLCILSTRSGLGYVDLVDRIVVSALSRQARRT
ncbi:MAG: D-alanine--D-alanine ligase [Planctomycetota bacterium]|nr:D-alanine--D-alanine ligase [Planctomycetota bacterium]